MNAQAALHLFGKCNKHILPYALAAPSDIALVISRWWTISDRQIPPRRYGLQTIDDTIENLAIIAAHCTAPQERP